MLSSVGFGAEPDHDRGDGHGGVVAVAELVIPGRDGPELFEAVEGPFDLVAVLVPVGVEVRWPAATRTTASTAGQHVVAFRDGVRDSARAQGPAVRPGTVGLIGGQVVEAFAGPSVACRPADADRVEQRHQFFGVCSLPGCDPGDQAAATSFGEQMQFGGQASSGAADPLCCPRFSWAEPPLRAPAAF
jgi:hypothetical protein